MSLDVNKAPTFKLFQNFMTSISGIWTVPSSIGSPLVPGTSLMAPRP